MSDQKLSAEKPVLESENRKRRGILTIKFGALALLLSSALYLLHSLYRRSIDASSPFKPTKGKAYEPVTPEYLETLIKGLINKFDAQPNDFKYLGSLDSYGCFYVAQLKPNCVIPLTNQNNPTDHRNWQIEKIREPIEVGWETYYVNFTYGDSIVRHGSLREIWLPVKVKKPDGKSFYINLSFPMSHEQREKNFEAVYSFVERLREGEVVNLYGNLEARIEFSAYGALRMGLPSTDTSYFMNQNYQYSEAPKYGYISYEPYATLRLHSYWDNQSNGSRSANSTNLSDSVGCLYLTLKPTKEN